MNIAVRQVSGDTSKKVGARPEHNIAVGPVTKCQVCGSENLEPVLDLGHQPLCDSLLSKDQLNQPEVHYPLRQVWCRDCTLNQIDYVVPGDVVFHQDYPYKSGVTLELVTYQKQLAKDLLADMGTKPGGLIVDVGSNDGTLLTAFKNEGMEVQGVEPTNIAQLANEAGIPTIHAPFDQAVAEQIVKTRGHASAVTATNSFAHIAALGDVIEGLEILLEDGGYFCLENHYLGAIIDRFQFDSIYHEHLKSYTLRSLVELFSHYDFTVVDARKVSRYGGNIRVYVAKGKGARVLPSVGEMLAEEAAAGMHTPDYYETFRKTAIAAKDELLSLILKLKSEGHSVVGNSCPGRCSTLLNFAGIGPDLLPYLAEQPASLKLGKYLPGTHIPIVNNERLFEEQPDYVVLLAWHYADSIIGQLRERGLKSKFIMPLPTVSVID